MSSATPTYGAVSFPVELARVPREDPDPRPPVWDGNAEPSSIRVADLRRHVSVLAADDLEGRGAGHAGEAKAAAYIAGELERIGLEPGGDARSGTRGWLQPFPLHARRPARPFEVLQSQNVIGILEGSDPRLKNEVIVVGAHYDGQGRSGEADMGRREAGQGGPADTIWNSANDNAAAVAALIELAEWVAGRPRPARSIVFAAFGAEEHGLVGSLHYTSHPAVAWDRHAAMINLEMLGWAPDQTLNVRATDTSRQWPDLLREASRRTGVSVTMRQPQLTNDTDHYGFGVRGVPAVHYGVGGSRRHYHRVTDDLDGIAFAALAARTRHVAALLLQIADRPARLPFSWVHPPDAGITGVALSPAEVGSLALGPDRGGVKITAVAPGLPAERSGLRAGDVVIAVGGKPVARESAAVRIIGQAFSALDRDGSLQLSVVRKGETVQVELRARASMP
jgi:hypothetical protein